MRILLYCLASSLLAATDLDSMMRELGSPRLEARAAAERQLSAALRLSVGHGSVGDRPGDSRAGPSQGGLREQYESAVQGLRASLVGSASGATSGATSGGRQQDQPGAAAARRRLSVILGGDDRFLGLAVRLAADGHPAVRPVGEDAVLAQLNRWSRSVFAEPSGAAFDQGRQSLPWPEPLLKLAAFRVALDPNGSASETDLKSSGASAFDLLDRRGGAPLPIVLDPGFVERMARRPAPRLGASRIEGTWTELLKELCMIHDGAYQLQGYRYPSETFPSDLVEAGADLPPARAWLHVVQRGTTQIAPTGRDLRELGSERIVNWCKGVLAEGNLIRQGASARALAALDWPAAIHWLERRWAWYGDVVALEGLMAAAARGRVAPSLQDPRCLRAILDLVERDAAELAVLAGARSLALAPETIEGTGQRHADAAQALDSRLQRLALGLRNLVPMMPVIDVSSAENSGSRTASGIVVQPMAALLYADFHAASTEGQWLRLAVSEGLAVPSPEAAAAARQVLADPALLGDSMQAERRRPLRRQALRTLGIVRSRGASEEAVQIAQVGDLFAFGFEGARDPQGLGLELGRLEPITFTDPGGFPNGALLGRREALAQLLIWAALAADQRVASEGGSVPRPAPRWAVVAAEAGLREWAASKYPDVRGVEWSALRQAAREVRVLGGEPIRSLLAWVSPSLSPEDRRHFESICLRAGALDAAGRMGAFERALSDLGDPAGETEDAWLDLAALCADATLGPRARRELLQSLSERLTKGASGPAASSSTLVFAAERALRALQEARLDGEVATFREKLRQAAKKADHPLAQRFIQVGWPTRSTGRGRDLERLDPVHPPVFSFQ